MENTIVALKRKLDTLTIFRGLLEDPVIYAFCDLADEIDDYFGELYMYAEESDEDPSEYSCGDEHDLAVSASTCIESYCEFVSQLFGSCHEPARTPSALSIYVRDIALRDENFYVVGKAAGKNMGKQVEDSLARELGILQEFSQLTSAQARKALPSLPDDILLPSWSVKKIDLAAEYKEMIGKLPVTGYGMYARYRAFSVKDGQIAPVKYPDSQRLDQLYRYERERELIIRNTEALVSGKGASNMLLYGDAGTGKSSTIKAVANEYADQGLRLIEIKKEQLYEIPDILNELSGNPLKFILFIDDLSFSGSDDNFSTLKAVLEGSVAAFGNNIAIYATSNRRHLVRETMSQREGDDIHVNDTLQELTSLAARFGLNITFSSPGKQDYLDIVKNLAKEYGIKIPEDELFLRAERFAIRASGRSPRVAKQFIELEKIGISY